VTGTTPKRDSARALSVCAVLCTVAFIITAVLVLLGSVAAPDRDGILAVRTIASPAVTGVMIAASSIAHGKLSAPLAVLLAVLIYRLNGRDDAILYVAACLIGEVLYIALKEVIRHHRPTGISPKLTDAGSFGFPSGHTMMAIVIFGLGAVMVTRRASHAVRVGAVVAAALLVCLVGMSRIYLGAHWPSDVIGALFAGVAWSAACLIWEERRTGRIAANAPGETQRPYSAA
jgi:undecaprenyl-diphosphatase